jgi:hypothetical protein
MRQPRHAVRSRCLVVLLLGLILPLGSPAAGPREEIDQALRSGIGAVLVVASARRPSPADEAYSDWAEYLNNFSSRAAPVIRIINTTAAEYRNIVAAPLLKTEFATLFIRDRDHVLQYDGMILEPQIYLLGQSYLLGHNDFTPQAGYGLRQTAIQLR